MANYKSTIKDQIHSDKRELESSITKGAPIDMIEFWYDCIKKDYNQLNPRTKTEEKQFYNFICTHDDIIKRATRTRINFIKYFLSNLEHEQEIFKRPENIEGMNKEMEMLKEQLEEMRA